MTAKDVKPVFDLLLNGTLKHPDVKIDRAEKECRKHNPAHWSSHDSMDGNGGWHRNQVWIKESWSSYLEVERKVILISSRKVIFSRKETGNIRTKADCKRFVSDPVDPEASSYYSGGYYEVDPELLNRVGELMSETTQDQIFSGSWHAEFGKTCLESLDRLVRSKRLEQAQEQLQKKQADEAWRRQFVAESDRAVAANKIAETQRAGIEQKRKGITDRIRQNILRGP